MSVYISNDRSGSFGENCAVTSTLTGDGFRELKHNNAKTKPNQTHTTQNQFTISCFLPASRIRSFTTVRSFSSASFSESLLSRKMKDYT